MANQDLFDKITSMMDVSFSPKQREDATKLLVWIFGTLNCDALKIYTDTAKRVAS
jgi:hypothetical protein